MSFKACIFDLDGTLIFLERPAENIASAPSILGKVPNSSQ